MFGLGAKSLPDADGTYRLYVVFDRVAEQSGPIFSAINDGVALRQYRHIIESVDAGTQDEYRLLCLGVYDPNKALVIGLDVAKDITPEVVS